MPETTTQELKAIFSGDTASYEKAMRNLNNANQSVIESDNKVKNNIAGLARELTLAETPADALAASVGRLAEVFKVSLGASLGAVAIQHVATDMRRAREEAEGLERSFMEVMGQNNTTSVNSAAQLRANLQSSREEAEKLKEAASALEDKFSAGSFKDVLGGMANIVASPGDFARAFGGEVGNRRQQAGLLDEQAGEAEKALAAKERERAEVLRISREQGEGAAKAKQMELRFAEELYEVEKRDGAIVANAVKERQAQERTAFQEAQQRARDTIETETRITAIKRDGAMVEIRSANERLALARKQLSEAAPGDDTAKANATYQAAKASLEAAQDAYRLNQSNAILETRIAQLRGSEEDKRIKALEYERQFLEWKKDNIATPDEMRGINADLEKNRQQAQIAADAKRMGEIAGKLADVDTSKGFGSKAETQALRERADIAWELVEAAKQKANFDEREYKNLVTNAKEADRAVQQKEAENRLEEIQNSLMEERLKIEGGTKAEADKRYSITQAQINATKAEIEVLRSLNAELARGAELKLQGLQNDLQSQQMQAFGESTLERNNRIREQQRTQRANERQQRRFQQNEGLTDVQRDISGNVISGRDPVTGERKNVKPPDTFRDFFDPEKNQERKDKDKQDRQDRDKAFRDQFKNKEERERDEKNQKTIDEQNNRERKGQQDSEGSKGIIKKLDELLQKLDKLVLG